MYHVRSVTVDNKWNSKKNAKKVGLVSRLSYGYLKEFSEVLSNVSEQFPENIFPQIFTGEICLMYEDKVYRFTIEVSNSWSIQTMNEC